LDLNSPIFFLLPIAWLAAWIGISIVFRKSRGKPLFPRVPRNAVFAEAWRSGRSMQNLLTQLGGASNCLLVYVADGALTIVPVFPFNLMFLPEVYGLEVTAPVAEVRVAPVEGLFGKRLELTIGDRRFEVSLKDERGFCEALESKGRRVTARTSSDTPTPPRLSWRVRLFQVFAIVWGLAAIAGSYGSLADDLRFRTQGIAATGKIVGHTGEEGSRNDTGVVRYEVAGRSYTLTSLRGSGVYRVGDRDTVHYLPGDPAGAREDDSLPFDLLFAGLGSIMLAVGLTLGWIAKWFGRAINVSAASQTLQRT
jgi:hypothetical protein